MARISASIVTTLLLGRPDRRRQLQDFPVLVDVWEGLAFDPTAKRDLLITPHRDVSAAAVASHLEEYLDREGDHMIAYLQGLVVARLSFEEIWKILIPATRWWSEHRSALEKQKPGWTRGHFHQWIEEEFDLLMEAEVSVRSTETARRVAEETVTESRLLNVQRQLVKLGLLIGVLGQAQEADGSIETLRDVAERLNAKSIADYGARALKEIFKRPAKGVIFIVSANRQAEYAVSKSVPAIKADAARQLFNISCRELKWAILDSGIDAAHPAFRDETDHSRVVATYDFGKIRQILNKANRFQAKSRQALAKELAGDANDHAAAIDKTLLDLANAMAREQPTDWSRIEPLIKREPPVAPINPHGTHVAGILAANWEEDKSESPIRGVCPDIKLYDFRVLGPDMEQTEFAIIAALQFIRYLNDRNASSIIDGVNMSLSIPHNVRNYACGRTPVCLEAEVLSANGVVVVAAAGNHGYQSFRLSDDRSFESYASSSITDPGNAEAVITVGATHRYWPHTYGVSFFSSRGPTGDGRLKPDILAPGERIESCVPDGQRDTLDGTSMAAPHVSGAAALLMARHRELKGNPRRIKEILCGTATDLGRERAFQGHGMLDVLRALQSI